MQCCLFPSHVWSVWPSILQLYTAPWGHIVDLGYLVISQSWFDWWWWFFSEYSCSSVSLGFHWDSVSSTEGWIRDPGPWDTEGQLYSAISHKGIEHPWILVSAGVLESIPHQYRGTTVCILRLLSRNRFLFSFFVCLKSQRLSSVTLPGNELIYIPFFLLIFHCPWKVKVKYACIFCSYK